MFNYGEFCPISILTNGLCERWTLQIIHETVLAATKFSEFKRHISRTRLKNRLRTLKVHDIIIRKPLPGGQKLDADNFIY